MLFGDPYRFAIWVEHVPQWGDSIKNGFFYFFLNGNMYPNDIRTSTLFVDYDDVIDSENALVAMPYDDKIFNAPINEAFKSLFEMTYPQPTPEDEYPEGICKFKASPTIILESGAYFFAVSDKDSVRILGGKVSELVDCGEIRIWQDIKHPVIEDITLEKKEINEIISRFSEYTASLLQLNN
ncbi:immunity 42 family protein [Pantoea sp.]|uniref:immunity 42 family protein n=1 Tax=Pantoea sp. TaxID=69393 RepID=UPI0028ABEAED|nr:immunity 42 family protein [Pantoea sp.]